MKLLEFSKKYSIDLTLVKDSCRRIFGNIPSTLNEEDQNKLLEELKNLNLKILPEDVTQQSEDVTQQSEINKIYIQKVKQLKDTYISSKVQIDQSLHLIEQQIYVKLASYMQTSGNEMIARIQKNVAAQVEPKQLLTSIKTSQDETQTALYQDVIELFEILDL